MIELVIFIIIALLSKEEAKDEDVHKYDVLI